MDIPSLEGMYVNADPTCIILSSLRPTGRQAFTCCHEIGHHIFGHGHRIDSDCVGIHEPEFVNDPEEDLVQQFAGFLLMPKVAVLSAFRDRGTTPDHASPEDAYAIASWFGVGYTTLIQHMQWALGVIQTQNAEKLFRTTPSSIRTTMLGRAIIENLIPVDERWRGRAIDIEVGDNIITPATINYEGESLHQSEKSATHFLFCGTRPGISRLLAPSGWASYVRVRRRQYMGLNRFRHLEDPDHV